VGSISNMRYFTGQGKDVTVEIQGYLERIASLEKELASIKKKSLVKEVNDVSDIVRGKPGRACSGTEDNKDAELKTTKGPARRGDVPSAEESPGSP